MDMENLGTEVSAKIRSAIKAKLVELNAYVDDELPDYIMVMIANKKTEAQMEEDLTLFLNEKAPTFAQWLHSVLAKLQKVTFGGGMNSFYFIVNIFDYTSLSYVSALNCKM